MIKKTHILFFLLLISHFAFSQSSVRFKRFYDIAPYSWPAESYSVTALSDGYVVSGIVVDTIGGYYHNRLVLLKVDTLGNPIWEKRYGNYQFQFIHDGWNMMLKDSALYFSTMVVKPNAVTTSVLIKYDLQGDSLWGKEYEYSPSLANNSWFSLYGKSFTQDKGFAFTGRQTDGTSNSIVLLKTDSLGNEEWRSTMNTASYFSTGSSVFFDTINQKYIISASHNPPSLPDEMQGIQIITDINGNKLAQYSITSPYGGGVGSLIQTSDNNFIGFGAYGTGEMQGSNSKMKYWIVKFNVNGTIIWSKLYGESSIWNWFNVSFRLQDNSIIAAGSNDTLNNQGFSPNPCFQVQKINENGDSLWARTISVVEGTALNYFAGGDRTLDGGIVLTGYQYAGIPSFEMNFCLIKLDEWGCDTVDCQLVGVTELQNTKFDFTLYPNPSNTNLNITITSKETPEYYQIIDITGKIIATEKISTTNFIINTQNLAPSVYNIYVFSKNKPAVSKRFSVIH